MKKTKADCEKCWHYGDCGIPYPKEFDLSKCTFYEKSKCPEYCDKDCDLCDYMDTMKDKYGDI